MSGMGKCCCGDCCLEEGQMPYTTATLKSPYYPCEGGGGPGGGVGVGVGEGEGEEPSYPTENFVKQTTVNVLRRFSNAFCGLNAT